MPHDLCRLAREYIITPSLRDNEDKPGLKLAPMAPRPTRAFAVRLLALFYNTAGRIVRRCAEPASLTKSLEIFERCRLWQRNLQLRWQIPLLFAEKSLKKQSV